jgi:hypothetical protein
MNQKYCTCGCNKCTNPKFEEERSYTKLTILAASSIIEEEINKTDIDKRKITWSLTKILESVNKL